MRAGGEDGGREFGDRAGSDRAVLESISGVGGDGRDRDRTDGTVVEGQIQFGFGYTEFQGTEIGLDYDLGWTAGLNDGVGGGELEPVGGGIGE